MKQTLNMRQQLSINLRYCYSSKRATQNMSATRNSPTIGFNLNLRASPLSAVTVWLHYLPRCVRSIVTCGKSKTPTPPWLEVHLRKFVAVLLLRNKRFRVSQPASAGKEADLVNCKLSTACYLNSGPSSCAVWVSYRQTNSHCKN